MQTRKQVQDQDKPQHQDWQRAVPKVHRQLVLQNIQKGQPQQHQQWGAFSSEKRVENSREREIGTGGRQEDDENQEQQGYD